MLKELNRSISDGTAPPTGKPEGCHVSLSERPRQQTPAGRSRFSREGGLAAAVGLVVIAGLVISIGLGSFYTVDQGERAVLLTNGAISGVEDAGLHFKLPFVQSIAKISLHTLNWRFDKLNIGKY